MNQVVSHLMEHQTERGILRQFVYTKCQSAKFFQDLGFYEIAGWRVPSPSWRTGGGGFSVLLQKAGAGPPSRQVGGYRHERQPLYPGPLELVERAAKECDTVHLFVLSEEQSLVPLMCAGSW
mgnify:CR=1 FL=1